VSLALDAQESASKRGRLSLIISKDFRAPAMLSFHPLESNFGNRTGDLPLAFPVLPHQNELGRTALSFGHLLGCHRLDHNVA